MIEEKEMNFDWVRWFRIRYIWIYDAVGFFIISISFLENDLQLLKAFITKYGPKRSPL